MIKTTKPIKTTFCVPYGMLMTLAFRHFRVPLEEEAKDEEEEEEQEQEQEVEGKGWEKSLVQI